MRDHDNELFVRDLLQKLHDLHRRFTVQRAGRLIGQQNLRIVDQRPRNRHALHLSAGHLVGLFVQLVAQTDLFQRLHGALSPLGLAHARKRQRKLHVLQNRLVRDQVIALKDETDGMVAVGIPIPRGKVLRRASADDKIAGGILIQSADDVQKRRLSAAGRPKHSDKFMPPEPDRHALQRVNGGVSGLIVLYDLFQLKHWVTILHFRINRIRIHWIYEQIYGIADLSAQCSQKIYRLQNFFSRPHKQFGQTDEIVKILRQKPLVFG